MESQLISKVNHEIDQLKAVLCLSYHRSYLIDDIVIYKRSVGLIANKKIQFFMSYQHILDVYKVDLSEVYYNPLDYNIRDLVKEEKKTRVKLRNLILF